MLGVYGLAGFGVFLGKCCMLHLWVKQLTPGLGLCVRVMYGHMALATVRVVDSTHG